MVSHREEEKSITLLGNQNTKYADDYAPEVLETFKIGRASCRERV